MNKQRCPDGSLGFVGHRGARGPMGFSPGVVYLAGPMGQVSIIDSRAWRIMATERFRQKGIGIEDPTDRLGFDPELIVEGDKEAIRKSGALLAHAPKGIAFVGTSMEIFYAHEVLKIPVVTWGAGNGTCPSPWIVMHSDYVYETLDEALTTMLGD
jgi:hypothetical protein